MESPIKMDDFRICFFSFGSKLYQFSILVGQVASANVDSFTAATTAEEATKRGAKKRSVSKMY